ncbi:MAG TPA: hypothetical protein VFA33_24335 [Bryobacteraceae bacterium]|nr:hypothetical protein [Bryobacteraceae bacterium]
MKAYLNYPEPHMTLHGDSTCREIGKMRKVNQRNLTVDRSSFARVIEQIRAKEFRLGADAAINDVWLTVNFEDPEFEEAVARYVHRLLCQRYRRLKSGPIERHC